MIPNLAQKADQNCQWNPFHFEVKVMEKKNGRICLELHVTLGIMKEMVTCEEVFYVDEKRHILIYGIADQIPTSLRVAWIEEDPINPDYSIFNSYDIIGGLASLASRFYIQDKVYQGFVSQHTALKTYVEEG